MDFLFSANGKSGTTIPCSVCLLTYVSLDWKKAWSTNLPGKAAKRYYCLIVSFLWSKFILVGTRECK